MKTRPAENAGVGSDEFEAVQVAERPARLAELKLNRILVPIDFSECSLRALDYALAFAGHFHAKLIVLHVVEPAAQYADNYMSVSGGLDQRNDLFLQTARERLDELTRKRLGGTTATESLVRMGHAYSEIPDTAKAMGVDLIIIATHGYTGLKHVVLGSTAERVVRHAPCPVLTLRQPQ